MRSYWTSILIAAIVLAMPGCTQRQSKGETPAEYAAGAPEASSGGGAAVPPDAASGGTDAAASPEPVSPVRATIEMVDDRGVRSGLTPSVAPGPLTLVIRFTGPVDRVATQEALLQNLKEPNYTRAWMPAQITWRNDTEVLLRVPEPDTRRWPYIDVSVDGARDREGLPIKAEKLRLVMARGRAVVWRVPLAGDRPPETLVDLYDPLQPLAVSPDGAKVYLARPAASAPRATAAIPYVFDLPSGRRVAGTDTVDMSGRVTFVPSAQEILIQGGNWPDRFTADGQVLHEFRGVLNALGVGSLILAPRVSPDGRRLAAFHLRRAEDEWADLIIFNAAKRKLETYLGIARPRRNDITGPYISLLEWSPNGTHLLFDQEGDAQDTADCYVLDLGTAQKTLVGRSCTTGAWDPTGDRLWLGGVGVVGHDGRLVLPIKSADTRGFWSPDGSRLLLGDGVWDIASGRRTALPLPREASGQAFPLGWAGDGRSVFFGYAERETR